MKKIGDMYTDIIFTYCTPGKQWDHQSRAEITIPIFDNENNVKEFLNRELFPAIQRLIKIDERRQRDLIKISTAMDWTKFEKLTGLSRADELEFRNGKWFFCKQFGGQTEWSKELMKKYQFGRNSTNW